MAKNIFPILLLLVTIYAPHKNDNNISDIQGTEVYSQSECIGPLINGVCQGAIVPNAAYHQTCHGEMLNGQCTGPMF